MNRYGWLVSFVLVVTAFPGHARTWTDNKGNKSEGEYVTVLQGRVVVSVVNGGNVRIPFGLLSQEDQEYVRQKAEAQGRSNQLPSRPKPNNSKTAPSKQTLSNFNPDPKPDETNKIKLGDERTWTDSQGQTLQARLIGMDGTNVVLQIQGKTKPYPFEKFGATDQEYVRKEMIARGEGYKLQAVGPPPKVASSPPPSWVAQATPKPTGKPAQPQPPWVRPNWQKPPKPASSAASAKSPPAVAAVGPRGGGNAPPKPAPTAASPLLDRKLASAPPAANHAARSPTKAASGSPADASPLANLSPPAKVRICSACGQPIPDSCKVGDYCPNPKCGVYLQYEDTESGERVPAAPYLKTVGIPAGIAALVYCIAVGIVYMRMHFHA